MHQSDDFVALPPEVCELAAYLRKTCRRLARVSRMGYDFLDQNDFIHTSQVAVWEAFWTLNQSETSVDWVTHRAQLLELAERVLSRDIQGVDTIYGDYRTRTGTMTRSHTKGGRFGALRRVPVPGHWAAWRQIEPQATNQSRVLAVSSDYQPQEEQLQQGALAELRMALSEVLTPCEMLLLEEHYLQGKSQREMAQERAAADPLFAPKFAGDERGWRRYERRLGKAIERARKRAAVRLSSKWRHHLAAVGCS